MINKNYESVVSFFYKRFYFFWVYDRVVGECSCYGRNVDRREGVSLGFFYYIMCMVYNVYGLFKFLLFILN